MLKVRETGFKFRHRVVRPTLNVDAEVGGGLHQTPIIRIKMIFVIEIRFSCCSPPFG